MINGIAAPSSVFPPLHSLQDPWKGFDTDFKMHIGIRARTQVQKTVCFFIIIIIIF